MKTLRAKKIPMRTLMVMALAAITTAVMAASQEMGVMAGGWSEFKSQMTSFFYNGLGGDGMKGIGIVIAVIGVTLAVVSFVVHKINPQSRMPGWFTCLIVAVLGTLLFAGVSPILAIITSIRDTVFGWFGFDGFGQFS